MWTWIFKSPALAACGALGLACALLFAQTRIQAGRLDAAEAHRARVQSSLDLVLDANKNMAASVNRLKEVNEEMASMLQNDMDAIRRASIEIERQRTEIRANTDRVRQVRQELTNASPSCAELAQIDIVAVCPALGISLRDQARNQKF